MKNKFVILLIIIVLIVVGFFVFKNSNENLNSDNLENSINSEEIESEDENVENIIATEVNIVTNINTLTNPKIEDIAKNTFDEYARNILGYEKSSIGPMPNLFIKLKLATLEDINKWSERTESKEGYIKSDIKYEVFKNAVLQYVNEEYFVKFFSQYKNIDGFVSFQNTGGGSPAIGVEEATLISRVGNTFNFKLKIKDLEMYDHYLYEDENIKEEDCYFEDEVAMEYINNRLVISKFNDSIILEGVYSLENTDVAYEFYKDGTVEYLMNMGVYTGTYDMSGEKELTITWKEETVWDVITSEEKTTEMTGKETVTVINDKKIRVESEHDGEVVINEFIKK